jgi:hypothetical protein
MALPSKGRCLHCHYLTGNTLRLRYKPNRLMLSIGLWWLYINISITILSGLENRDYGRRDPSRWPRRTIYPQKSALTSPTSGGRSVGIVRKRTQATEFSSIHYPSSCLSFKNTTFRRLCSVPETSCSQIEDSTMNDVENGKVKVSPQLYSRGWLEPVLDPLLFRKSGSAGNRTQTSESVGRNSDH